MAAIQQKLDDELMPFFCRKTFRLEKGSLYPSLYTGKPEIKRIAKFFL